MQKEGRPPCNPENPPTGPTPSSSTKWLIIGAVVFAVAIGIVAYVANRPSGGNSFPISTSSSIETDYEPVTEHVVYSIEIEGAGDSANSITYNTPTGDSQDTDAGVPWAYVDDFDPDAFLYVSAQNNGGGTISCTITVDGDVVSSNTSSGEYAIVTCQK